MAYADGPLPIGWGQTISQPWSVARMTEVLEVGTGCGYQAAVLAELGVEVFAVELEVELAVKARERLGGLGYSNVESRVGDGAGGWPEAATFDAILVAAAERIPELLLEQLAVGGRMCMPVRRANGDQELVLVHGRSVGSFERTNLGGVRFVPMR